MTRQGSKRAASKEIAEKVAFDIDRWMHILERAYRQWDAPSITLIAESGASPFQVLIATLLSLRTKDEVTIAAARRLFESAVTPAQMLALGEKKIRRLIYPVGFYPTKAARIMDISRLLLERYGGCVPDSIDQLLTLPGVGRKTANLVLVEGFEQPAICVDTHVHRISNRVGFVRTATPEKTEFALRERLPKPYWIRYNEILVAFGQVICRPVSPFCSRCPVERMCPRIGVDKCR